MKSRKIKSKPILAFDDISKQPKSAKEILDRAITILDDGRGYLQTKTIRVSDNIAVFEYGSLTAFDSEDGIERVQVMAYLNCPQQLLLSMGRALADFVLLSRSNPSFFSSETQTHLSCDAAEIAYARSILIRHSTPHQATVLANWRFYE